MYFTDTQHLRGLALLALFSIPVFAIPIADLTESSLETRDNWNANLLTFWPQTDFQPALSYRQKGEKYPNSGNCQDLLWPDFARSIKAPVEYKCTLYSDKGCHGWRSNEFDEKGIVDLGPKMSVNGAAFRCCKIGTSNEWGYCDAKLSIGTQ